MLHFLTRENYLSPPQTIWLLTVIPWKYDECDHHGLLKSREQHLHDTGTFYQKQKNAFKIIHAARRKLACFKTHFLKSFPMYWCTYWLRMGRHFCTDTGSKMISVCHSATTTAHLRFNKPGQQVHKYSGRSNTSEAPLEESLSHRCCQSHAMQVHRERCIHAHTW